MLLVGGCSLPSAGAAPSPGGWSTHDGYALRCQDVDAAACAAAADAIAARQRSEHSQEVVSILVTRDLGSVLCVASTAGNRCRTSHP